ncbi:MAG: aminoacyl-tRNA hydrolase [Desulfobacteraceae bacterium]|jgi:PTH1 family peptidyl-tRNA hydrolase
MPEHRVYLVAGLGNPGQTYADTRHNAGFLAIDALADQHGFGVQRNKFDVLFGRGRIGGIDVVLAKPQGFMNRSGPPLRRLADYFRIRCKQMIIVHDDIDLAFERLKIKEKGGDGGHKGIRSVIDAFGDNRFARVRVGVGRPQFDGDVVNHVLNQFNPDEQTKLDELIQQACQAIETILCKGIKEGMNRYNQRPR